jgi:hypothetical protein
MSYLLKNISLLAIVTLATISSNAIDITDSLPSCITTMKRNDSLVTSAEFEYKGQQWFLIGKKTTQPAKNYPDKMTTTKFYNNNCQLVCTWTRGGIAGLNKVLPDTIDKTKIIKVAEIVPEKIMELAIKNNAASITEYQYLGQPLYFLNKGNDRNAPKEMIVIEPYYDKNGIEIIRFQRANDPSFFRAQGWRPHTVQPEKLVVKGIVWYNTSKEKLK